MHSIDPELNYCLSCGDEYRGEFSRCAVCGRDLVKGADLLHKSQSRQAEQNRCVEIGPDDVLTDAGRGTLLEMKNLKRVLQKNGVAAGIASEDPCSGGCCGPQVVLRVRIQDTDRAGEILRAEHTRTTRLEEYGQPSGEALFNPLVSQTTCPACGYVFAPTRPDCPECGLCFC